MNLWDFFPLFLPLSFYIWVSVWWKTKNEIWEIYTSRIHWVARGTGTPKDRDEVNGRDVCDCDGWVCVLKEAIGEIEERKRRFFSRVFLEFFSLLWKRTGENVPFDSMHFDYHVYDAVVGRLQQRAFTSAHWRWVQDDLCPIACACCCAQACDPRNDPRDPPQPASSDGEHRSRPGGHRTNRYLLWCDCSWGVCVRCIYS